MAEKQSIEPVGSKQGNLISDSALAVPMSLLGFFQPTGDDVLMHAVAFSEYDEVEGMLKAGANCDLIDPSGLETPLMLAGDDTKMVNLLLQYGADVNLRTRNWTPLQLAAYQGFTKSVEALLKAGADTGGVSRFGSTALIPACFGGHPEIARLLLEFGADVNALVVEEIEDDWYIRRSALHAAAELKHKDIVVQLLLHDADVRPGMNNDPTPGPLPIDYNYNFLNDLPHKIGLDDGDGKYIVEVLCGAGATISDAFWNESIWIFYLALGIKQDIPQIIVNHKEPPKPSLKSLCRHVIRAHLLSPTAGNQNNLLSAIPQLPLPLLLKKYLAYYHDLIDSLPSAAEFLADAVSREAHTISLAKK